MAIVNISNKAVVVNPLKQSQALGATLAFLGLKRTMPLLHGSQGCTAFAKVILVRHFREVIPLSTTAMTEVTTILGGEDNVEKSILTLVEKVKPEIIGLCTTGLTETRGDDMQRIIKEFRKKYPGLNSLPIILVSAPDFKGALQDGYSAAIESIIRELPQAGETKPQQVNFLFGPAFTPGDVEHIKEISSSFGIVPVCVPDLSLSMDGHLEESWSPITVGGTTIKQLQSMGSSAFTLALGESMHGAAEMLTEKFGIPHEVFRGITGLETVDEFIMAMTDISGNPVPKIYDRDRQQLQDAMLDSHFYFSRKRISLALEPDLLWSTISFLQSMGAEIHAAVTTTHSPLLEQLPIEKVTIGDYQDFEQLAQGSDLLIGNSHTHAIAKRLHIPLYRHGFPIFDRLGNGQVTKVGYKGTMQMLFDIGNKFLAAEENKVQYLNSNL
ncbi:Nitrogenase FeMo-cofactor scaffold and assembly protein NifN [Richelia intracellularis HH01]|uniref:Nitrogenase iron-molybdenum cofactor biosynthesis protein NifN n=1 Tax=Richelia intracellularis HH01 TaxID=1165094 RepID=M1X4N8_9NOST|nr:nitrogenase iron-molybdenum cofactor biosynthesis protein NifN [Richelia intracellularis]CCH66471.1 Nitrogenase FeMo-cofactor scaffold and assembly protein NifN [Richelia intracellularis HH01]HAE05704.1 nitrogenase iron-molybdenum cofactor biosynthesis protein NifN [Richelia sp.]